MRERGFYRTGTKARPEGAVRISMPDGFSLGRMVSDQNYVNNGYEPSLDSLPWEADYLAAKAAADAKVKADADAKTAADAKAKGTT